MKADMTSSPETMNTNNNNNNPMQDQINNLNRDLNLYAGRLDSLVRDYRRIEDIMMEHIAMMKEWRGVTTKTLEKINESVVLLEDQVDEILDGPELEPGMEEIPSFDTDEDDIGDEPMTDRDDDIQALRKELSIALMERDAARRGVCDHAASRDREETGKEFDPEDAKRVAEEYGWDCYRKKPEDQPQYPSRAELDAELPYAIKNKQDLEWIRHLVTRALAEAERNALKVAASEKKNEQRWDNWWEEQMNHMADYFMNEKHYIPGASGAD
jgi:hypothetical protein